MGGKALCLGYASVSVLCITPVFFPLFELKKIKEAAYFCCTLEKATSIHSLC